MTKLEKQLIEQIKETNKNWNLFKKKDSLVLGISGGKDSLVMLNLLKNFDLNLFPVFINIYAQKNDCKIENGLTIIDRPIFNEIKNIKNPCFTCSKRKRQALFEFANEKNITKVAFAHHKNDVIETLLLNQIFSREISTMLAKQILFSGRFQLIRPLYQIPEKLITYYQKQKNIKTFSQDCGFEKNTKRKYIKDLLEKLQKNHPKINVSDNIFSAMKQIKSSYLPFDIL